MSELKPRDKVWYFAGFHKRNMIVQTMIQYAITDKSDFYRIKNHFFPAQLGKDFFLTREEAVVKLTTERDLAIEKILKNIRSQTVYLKKLIALKVE